MDESPILVETRPNFRIITLNRPQRLNSFTEDMHRALKAALDAAEADSNCRAMLITGAGRGFCAGQDLNDRLAKPGEKIVLGAHARAVLQSADPPIAQPALPGHRRGERRRRRRRRQYRARLRFRDRGEVGHASCRPSRKSVSFRIPAAPGSCRGLSAPPARAGLRCWPSR